MVISKLIGGLGNQLFQYAAGKRLAITLGTQLKFDITGLVDINYVAQRRFALDVFCLEDSIASAGELKPFTNPKRRMFNTLIKKKNNRIDGYIKEAHFHFDPGILSLGDNVYLDGYWQSEKYFLDVESEIRRLLKIIREPEGENLRLLDQIKGNNAISVHVRRGDYVKNQSALQFHGLCNIDYYQHAAKYIAEKIENPIFFVFSDEPDWASKNLNLPYKMVIVNHNDIRKGYEDLRLMSSCQHHIIANSTFSWWGAWLNPSKEKIVVAPKRWFNDPGVNTKDICPDSWVRI